MNCVHMNAFVNDLLNGYDVSKDIVRDAIKNCDDRRIGPFERLADDIVEDKLIDIINAHWNVLELPYTFEEVVTLIQELHDATDVKRGDYGYVKANSFTAWVKRHNYTHMLHSWDNQYETSLRGAGHYGRSLSVECTDKDLTWYMLFVKRWFVQMILRALNEKEVEYYEAHDELIVAYRKYRNAVDDGTCTIDAKIYTSSRLECGMYYNDIAFPCNIEDYEMLIDMTNKLNEYARKLGQEFTDAFNKRHHLQ